MGSLASQKASTGCPKLKIPENRIEDDYSTINVLVTTLLRGSHIYNSVGLTNWLTEQLKPDGTKMYNVTALVYQNADYFNATDGLQVVRHPESRTEN